MAPAERKTAEERRTSVLAAAVHEFAEGGLAGTSTETIARRAGISQPYLFRLYPTKKALFLATVEFGFDRVRDAFAAAADGRTGESALEAMGDAYDALIEDRKWLLLQLHAYAACDDPEIRAVTRRRFGQLWQQVERSSGGDPAALRSFFGAGMLLNVVAAMDLSEVDTGWARGCAKGSS